MRGIRTGSEKLGIKRSASASRENDCQQDSFTPKDAEKREYFESLGCRESLRLCTVQSIRSTVVRSGVPCCPARRVRISPPPDSHSHIASPQSADAVIVYKTTFGGLVSGVII